MTVQLPGHVRPRNVVETVDATGLLCPLPVLRAKAALGRASAGEFDGMMIAFPCSTASISRFFDASGGTGGDRGPPPVRDHARSPRRPA